VRRSTERHSWRTRAGRLWPRHARFTAKASQNAITPRTNSRLSARNPVLICGGRHSSSQMRTSTRRNFRIGLSLVELHTSESSFEWTIIEFGRVGITFGDRIGGLLRAEVGFRDRKTETPQVRKPFRALVSPIPTCGTRQESDFFSGISSNPGPGTTLTRCCARHLQSSPLGNSPRECASSQKPKNSQARRSHE